MSYSYPCTLDTDIALEVCKSIVQWAVFYLENCLTGDEITVWQSKGEGHQLPYWLLFKGGGGGVGPEREEEGRGKKWRGGVEGGDGKERERNSKD